MADGSDTASGTITQKYLTSWLRKVAISPTQNIAHTCSHCGASSPLLHRLVHQTLEHDLVLGAGTLRDAITCGNQCKRQAHKFTCGGGTSWKPPCGALYKLEDSRIRDPYEHKRVSTD